MILKLSQVEIQEVELLVDKLNRLINKKLIPESQAQFQLLLLLASSWLILQIEIH